MRRTDTLGEWTYRYFDAWSRKLYDVNLENRMYQEISIVFDKEELGKHVSGLTELLSGWHIAAVRIHLTRCPICWMGI